MFSPSKIVPEIVHRVEVDYLVLRTLFGYEILAPNPSRALHRLL